MENEDGQLRAKENIYSKNSKNDKKILNFLSFLEFLLYIFSFARSCPSSFSITILNYLLEVWTVNPFGSFWRSISVGSKHFNLLYIYIYIYI